MHEAAPTRSGHDALVFLEALYGERAPGFMTLWRRQDRTTLWLPANDVVRASAIAVASARTMDTYVGIGLRREAGATHERGKLGDVIGVPSVWDDIDLRGPAHKKERLPDTREEAFAFLAEVPLPPSLIVDSGWGIQPHWLLDRPWIFADAGERQAAAELVQRFQAELHRLAAHHGWTLDSTHDLTRVLRIPGTLNHKLAPVPVRLLAGDPDRRYSRDSLTSVLPPATAEAWSEQPVSPVDLPPTLPVVDLSLLAVSDRTRELIRRGRGADPGRYPSRSEAAWRALRDLVETGCRDADIAAIFLDPANAVGEKAREQGRRWLAGEFSRARRAVQDTLRLVVHVSDRPGDATSPRPVCTASDLSEGAARILVDVA